MVSGNQFETGMETISNLLIVAGAGRNVGKTEFACRLIEQWSRHREIYALKVSAIYPDEDIYHGDHANLRLTENLFEETRYDLTKDTSRMLRAGAAKVYYLQGDGEQIRAGFWEFQNRIPKAAPVICESGSLWKFVRPGLLVLVKTAKLDVKPRALKITEHSTLIVESDGLSGFAELSAIRYSDLQGWSCRVDSPDHG